MVSIETKRKLKLERLDLTPDIKTETHHRLPHFKGGNGDIDNLQCVTLPEHALEHLADAETAEDWQTARGHYAAVTLIVRRMTPAERETFDNCTH